MKILSLEFNDKEEAYLKYVEGTIDSSKNYIGECCEGNYFVEFKYKGFTIDEELINTALTYYFDEKYNPNEVTTTDQLGKMFKEHEEKRESEQMSEIKNIVLKYIRKILFEV